MQANTYKQHIYTCSREQCHHDVTIIHFDNDIDICITLHPYQTHKFLVLNTTNREDNHYLHVSNVLWLCASNFVKNDYKYFILQMQDITHEEFAVLSCGNEDFSNITL